MLYLNCMKPFFSIVIPTLNEEKYLSGLLNDLTQQKEKDFEVIIVDGKSDDQTVKKAKDFENKLKLKIIYSEKRNLCFQRNLGARKSKGNYLIFLDADIRIHNNYLSTIKKAIEKESSLFLTTYHFNDSNKFDMFLTQIANYSLRLLKLINKQAAPGYNFIILKDIFNKVGGFNEKATISEDHNLSMRIQKAGVKIHIIPKKLLKWSFRRIKKDGYIPILFKYGVATFHSLFIGEVTDKKLGYQMGGHHFKSQK